MNRELMQQRMDDLAQRLPTDLRGSWVVIPGRVLPRLFAVGLILGSAFALLVAGLWLGIDELRWLWPAALLLLAVATRYAPWWRDDRALSELCPQTPTEPPTGRDAL